MRYTAFLLAGLAALASANLEEAAVTTPLTIESRSANLHSLLSSEVHSASVALHSLSVIAATATGSLGTMLRSEYSSLKSELSAEKKSASAELASMSKSHGASPTPSGSKSPVNSGGSSTGGASPANTGSTGSQGMAAATGVPVVMGAVGVAVLAML